MIAAIESPKTLITEPRVDTSITMMRTFLRPYMSPRRPPTSAVVAATSM
ncbi:Uncharacterised protein [Mycobacteroides abscessus subsp. abscessus]|nr:Uncharacterised protein [Mycobacteroides abscessus subsp. abscessus]